MVILDSGFFSSFDCGQRTGAIFATSFLAQVAIVASLSAWLRKPSRYGPAIEMIDRPSFLTRRRLVAWAMWAAIFAVVAAICSLLRTTTAILLDSTSIVETSCTGPLPGEYRLDRAKVKITFGHDPTWLTKRPLEAAYLEIAQADKPRPIFIHLLGRPDSRELLELAPEAMVDYSRYRSYLGVR